MEKEILYKFNDKTRSAKQLTLSVLQATQLLTILNAELARILRVQCSDIGNLYDAHSILEENTESMTLARKFIYFYNLLHDHLQGDAVAMRHWIRTSNKFLKGIPMLMIIDDDRLDEIIGFLESPHDHCSQEG